MSAMLVGSSTKSSQTVFSTLTGCWGENRCSTIRGIQQMDGQQTQHVVNANISYSDQIRYNTYY